MGILISDLTSTDWFRAFAWTVGLPVAVTTIILGTAAVGEWYCHFVAGVSQTLSPFNRPWFTEHRKGFNWILWAFYFLSQMSHWVLIGCLAALAIYIASWAVWCLVSDRARDTPARVYCSGWLLLAAFITLFAMGLYQLEKAA